MAPTPPQAAGQKRKATASHTTSSRKRQKAQDARAIRVQSADAALSTSGELNVASFIKAREFEINALDKSMQKSRKGLMSRAFQQVPRSMRRRTASHNVKKVPRRLRRRAEREMKEDNTPTVTARRRTPSRRLRLRLETAKAAQIFNKKSLKVRQKKKEAKSNAKKTDPEDHVAISRVPRIKKNKLLEPPRAISKFKRRQVNKTWLPTHLWHAKRAHMTKPTEPLWRMAIPITPNEKSYRPTHRAGGSRGCIAWDMSYMSTIGLQGPESSLEGLLKAINFSGEGWQGAKYTRWKSGSRSASGWAYERDNDQQAIAPIAAIWCAVVVTNAAGDITATADEPAESASRKPAKRRLFVRVHPSAFHRLWLEVIKVAKMQRPQVLLEDLRFEIGSIEITGPGSTEALLGVLRPVKSEMEASSTGEVWTKLAGLTNPANLPANAILSFNVSDPRLRHPPSQVVLPEDEAALSALNELTVVWPVDKAPKASELFSQKRRHLAVTSMPSQKAVNRRKAETSSTEEMENDPKIPVTIIASRSEQVSSNAQGTWTVLLPWKCLDSVWRSVMYYSLTSGGTPRFGGLDQKRQVLFEHEQPWFPADFSGTDAGQAWERTQSENRFDEWLRRPPSRRIAWDAVDLGNSKKGEHGNGWACDWEYLLEPRTNSTRDNETYPGEIPTSSDRPPPTQGPSPRLLTQRQRKAAKADAERVEEKESRRRNTSSPESEAADPSSLESELAPSTKMLHVPRSQALSMFKGSLNAECPTTPALTTIRVTFLARGTPNAAARVYRLPSSSEKTSLILRKQWLSLDAEDPGSKPKGSQQKQVLKKDKLNHRGYPTAHSALPKDPLSHVQYLPPDAHPDVVAQYGPKDEPESSWPSAQEREEQLQQLMFPHMTMEERIKHPACPDTSDLIGFVTTGAYNLAEGRGVAIANIWVQKVLEGWKHESTQNDARSQKQKDRERHLCIVRNAGEGVGRLALWQLC